MPATPITLNVKAPPATTSEAFGFFSTTTSRTQRRNAINGFIYDAGAHV